MTIKELRPKTNTIAEAQTSNRITIIDRLDTADLKEIESLVNRMELEASYYMKIYKRIGRVLLRGVPNSPVMAYESHSVANRTPMNSNVSATKIFDQALRDLGFRAVRSNSIFATGDPDLAEAYGPIHIIVPKNTAKFTWGRDADDLIINKNLIKSLAYDDNPTEIDPEKLQNEYDFTDDDFAGAVRSGYEVMISGAYFAIHNALWNQKIVDAGLLPSNLYSS